MDQRLLQYFNSELRYIRGMSGEFAKAYPKIARRLNLEEFECADPYVERLLEGFAFLAARVHLKMDDEFPRFTQHLFEMVYPDYLAQTPSMVVVQLEPDFESGSLEDGFLVERGSSLRSQIRDDEQTACEYRTAHDVTIWPIQVDGAAYFTRDTVNTALPPKAQRARAGIRINLKSTHEKNFNEIACEDLEFYLRGGMEQAAHLYEQIFANVVSVGVRDVKNDRWLSWLSSECIEPVGYDDEEALLPCRQQSFQGYRLLKEYFSFHQRFLFFRLCELQSAFRQCESDEIEIVVLFDRSDRTLQSSIEAINFSLYSTPAVNLFPRRVERVQVDPSQHEFHVVTDRTRPMDYELYQVDRVLGLGEHSEDVSEFNPFYGETALREPAGNSFYTLRRTPRVESDRQGLSGLRTSYLGSESYISLVDGHQAPIRPEVEQLEVFTQCTNRDLPLSMPVGRSATDFTLEVSAPVAAIKVLAGPTAPKASYANQAGELQWRLINHLSLNYLSIVDSGEGRGAASLRDLLTLYADMEEQAINQQIDGVRSVESRAITRRLPIPGPISFGRGLEVSVTLDDRNFEGFGVSILGMVLSRFFSRYVSINSFTETVLKTDERGEVMRWRPKIGVQKIL